MTVPVTGFSPYSSVIPYAGALPQWYPEDHRDRVGSYLKYDEFYWNDHLQFKLRVLVGEEPLYIPNARTIVDTTSHYLLKGLQISVDDPEKHSELKSALDALLKREMFYSRFHVAKHSGVARGDFAFHITADPRKPEGSRITLNSIDPCLLIPIYDEDDLDKLVRLHIVDIYYDAEDPTQQKLKKLTYEYVQVGSTKRVSRSEGIYKLDDKWWGQQPNLIKTTIPEGLLPPEITTIPVYWFKNLEWQGQQFGSSELRGMEKIIQGVSQAATDQEMSLALEGLGVYATDGGRPVDNSGVETDWEVSPGKVMEVPAGSYFRRVEGVGSVKPSMDHINYIESKLREATGLSDVALGRVDVQVAQSGIALAIKFMPTLAKIEERDQAGVERLRQLFFDWQGWHAAYEKELLDGDVEPVIGQKLPDDRVAKVNELNNMIDREVISRAYYRAEMQKLGYVFPDDIEDEIQKEKEAEAELAAKYAPAGLQANAEGAVKGTVPPPPGKGGNGTLPTPGNRSNNKNKPNESKGTESGQTPRRQARGGKP